MGLDRYNGRNDSIGTHFLKLKPGISITIQHPWGQSLYAHLKESKVSQDQEVKAGDPIGLSGQTGSAFGEHLHFAIKPNDADTNNGYLGFIDPSSYFAKPEEKPPQPQEPLLTTEPSKIEEQTVEEQKPQVEPSQSPVSPSSPEPQVIVKEVIKEVPVVNQEEIQKQVEEKLRERLKSEQDDRRKLANEARVQKKKDNLNKILGFVREKKTVTNADIRDLLHISQSAATNYLSELVGKGSLKREGKSKYIRYYL